MNEAIRQLKRDPSLIEYPVEESKNQEVRLQGTYLRDILLRSFGERQSGDEGSEEAVVNEGMDDGTGLQLNGLFKEDSRIIS